MMMAMVTNVLMMFVMPVPDDDDGIGVHSGCEIKESKSQGGQGKIFFQSGLRLSVKDFHSFIESRDKCKGYC